MVPRKLMSALPWGRGEIRRRSSAGLATGKRIAHPGIPVLCCTPPWSLAGIDATVVNMRCQTGSLPWSPKSPAPDAIVTIEWMVA